MRWHRILAAATLLLYEDPDDDGDPTDGQLLTSVLTTMEQKGTETLAPVVPVADHSSIGTDANFVLRATAVPEPSTELLTLAGLAALGSRCQRRGGGYRERGPAGRTPSSS